LFELLVHCLKLPNKLKNKVADVTAALWAAAQIEPKAAISSCTPAGPLRLNINDRAHELLVAVLLLLGCWDVRTTGSCCALRSWGGLPPPPSAPLQAE
jgi:hypothetical protein